MVNVLENAMILAITEHAGQKCMAGMPYILHPASVMNRLKDKGYGIDYLAAGIMHDMVEDCDTPDERIRATGVSEEVIEALHLLTHNDDAFHGRYDDERTEAYIRYIEKLMFSNNGIAVAVKIADLEDNASRWRMEIVKIKNPEMHKWCVKKYKAAYKILTGKELEVWGE